jgi:hypothetical protein
VSRIVALFAAGLLADLFRLSGGFLMFIFTPMMMAACQRHSHSAATADITTGLVSYWLMNDGSGTTFADSISSHNGTLTSSALWVSDYVTFTAGTSGAVADHADYNVGGALTVFGWVNRAASANITFVGQNDYGVPSDAWTVISETGGSGNKLRVAVSNTANGSISKDYTGSQTVLDSTWHSWAFRFGFSTLDLFVDGVKDASVTKTVDDAMASIFNSTAPISFGDLYNSGVPAGGGAGGSIKKVRLYNIVKTDADIAAMHAAGA